MGEPGPLLTCKRRTLQTPVGLPMGESGHLAILQGNTQRFKVGGNMSQFQHAQLSCDSLVHRISKLIRQSRNHEEASS